MKVRQLLAALTMVAATRATAHTQGTTLSEAWVGSETEVYLRALAANGAIGAQPWSIRPFAPKVLERWAADSGKLGPWQMHLRSLSPSGAFVILRPSVSVSYNSAFPWGFNDGAVWQGKGANASATFGVAWHKGIFSMRLEPTAFWAQNSNFPLLVPPGGAGANPYLDALTPGSIDLPQRFGNNSYAQVDPGQSFIRVDAGGVAIGVSSENIEWGPAVKNPLLLGSNAAGFPHLFIGTSEAVRTPIGRFHGQVVYGRLTQSAYGTDIADNGARFGSGFALAWTPPSGKGIELGVARFFHKFWNAPGAISLAAPFASLFVDRGGIGSGPADNQLLSVFARVTAEQAGAEFWTEFGKNDHNADLRDATLEPEHNSAFSLGALKTLGDVRSAHFWSFRMEYLNGRVTSLQRFRGQSTFYDHSPITEGHTQFGQLLGSPLLERTGGLEFSADRWNADGRTGFVLIQRSMPASLAEGQTVAVARSQWALEANATRFRGALDVSARAGVVFDLNRTPGNDVTNFYAGFSLRGRR